ncbi:MAG: class I SAM-dependent methyltransferase [Acidobacteriota bacterium]
MPDAAVAAIGSHLSALANGGRVVEIGCGTGQIGAALFAGSQTPYVGLDLSVGMLARFGHRSRAPRIAADASQPWPLRPRSARLIFASRAAHLLDPQNLVREVARLANSRGAVFAVGRVERPEGGVRRELRRELQRLLGTRGFAARGGRAGHRAVLESVRQALRSDLPEGDDLAVQTVATWETEERPAAILASWRGKSGLGGHEVGPNLQNELLDEIETYARERFGALDLGYPSNETYEIAGVRLPPRGDIE